MPSPPLTKQDIETNIRVDELRGCWVWMGPFTKDGYGYKGRWSNLVHREAYKLWKGPIPKGYHLDHRCTSWGGPKACCNPEHLKPGPRGMNTMLAYIEKHKQMPWSTLRVARWMHNSVKEKLESA